MVDQPSVDAENMIDTLTLYAHINYGLHFLWRDTSANNGPLPASEMAMGFAQRSVPPDGLPTDLSGDVDRCSHTQVMFCSIERLCRILVVL